MTSYEAVFTQRSLMAYLQILFVLMLCVPRLTAPRLLLFVQKSSSPDRGRKADRPLMNDVDSAVSGYCDWYCRRIRCSYQKYPLPNGVTKQKQKGHIHISISLYEQPFRKLNKFTCLLEGASLYVFIFKKKLYRRLPDVFYILTKQFSE